MHAHQQNNSKGQLLYASSIDLGIAYSDADSDFESSVSSEILDDGNFFGLSGDGAASIPLSDSFSIQLDLGGFANFTGRGSDADTGEDNAQSYFYGGAHFSYRDPESHALGVFGQVGSANGGEDENATLFALGLEGQIYFNNYTFYAQAGYFEADDETENDVMTKAPFLRGVASYYFSERSKLSGEFALAVGEENDSSKDNIDGYSWGLDFEHQLSDHPIALVGGYRGFYVENDNSAQKEVVEHLVFVGISMHFGAGSIMENDRRGVAFDQPTAIGRWTAYTIDVID